MKRLWCSAALILGIIPALGQGYQPYDLLPLTLGTWWKYSDGSMARVAQVTEDWDSVSVVISNANTAVHGPGVLTLEADAEEIRVTGYSNPAYIIVNGHMGYAPFLKQPVILGRTWAFSLTSNGYPTHHTITVSDTDQPVTIQGRTFAHCTEVTVDVAYPSGYSPGQTRWIKNFYRFLPGVGCIERVLTSDDRKTNVLRAVAWEIKDPATAVVITGDPQSQYGVTGKTAKFSVEAYGSTALTYRWRKGAVDLVNGGRIAGATSATLTISGLTAADAGEYSVIVTSGAGSLTSQEAHLWIIPASQTFSLQDYYWPIHQGNWWLYDTRGNDWSKTLHRVESAAQATTCYQGCSPPKPFVVEDAARIYAAYGEGDGPGSFTPGDEWWDYSVVRADAWGFVGYDDNPGEMEMRVGRAFLINNMVRLGQTIPMTGQVHVNGTCAGQAALTFSFLDYTNLTTSAGRRFDECLHVRYSMVAGGSTEINDEWWAKGVGMVKKFRKKVQPGNTRTESYELIDYSAIQPTRITTQPASRTNNIGSTATFVVGAVGVQPLAYQWLKDGDALFDGPKYSGTTTRELRIADVQVNDSGLYTVQVRSDNGLTASASATLAVTDLLGPVLEIASHTDLQIVAGSSLILGGSASDAGRGGHGIASVTVNGKRADGGSAGGDSVINWTCATALMAGTNRLTVTARDDWGNATTTVIRIVRDAARPTIGFWFPKPLQQWGYSTIQARGWARDNVRVRQVELRLNGGPWVPATGETAWSAGFELSPGANTLQACAVDDVGNRSLTNAVKFTYNHFLPARGSYFGLFSAEPVARQNSGYLSLTASSGGLYSGSFTLDGKATAFSGAFDTTGRTIKTVNRVGSSPVTLTLALDLTPGADRLTGTLSDGTWVADLWADRAVFSSTTNKAPYAGRHTMAFAGGEAGNESIPNGFGHGAAVVDSAGKVTLSGYLADGSTWSQSSRVSKDGRWPLHTLQYGGKGLVHGWLSFTDQSPQGLLGGRLNWIKPPQTTRYYPLGFGTEGLAVGSRYVPPPNSSTRVIALTNGVVSFSGGNLAAPFTNQVVLASNNLISNASPNRLTLKISPASGLFGGTVVLPGTKTTNTFKGVLLQDQAAGFGYALGTNRSAAVVVEPSPDL